MVRKAFWLILGLIGVVIIGIILKGASESLTEGLSVQERMDILEAKHDARFSRLRGMEDEALARALWDQVRLNHYSMLEAAAFEAPPFDTQYTRARFERVGDYGSVGEFTEMYVHNYLATSTSEYRDCIGVREPFSFPFAHRLQWEALVLDNGERTRLPDLNAGEWQTTELRRRSDGFCFLKPRSESDAKPVTLTGEFTVQLPDDFIQFEFHGSDVGKTQTKAGYSVTLVAMGDYSYAVEVRGTEDTAVSIRSHDIIGEAIVSNGDYVQLRITDDARAEQYARVDVLLDDLLDRAAEGKLSEMQMQQALSRLREELAEEQGATMYKAFAFHGSVETAHVTLLHKGSEPVLFKHRFELPIHSVRTPPPIETIDFSRLKTMPVDGPVYSYQPVLLADVVDYSAQDMRDRIQIRQNSTDPDTDPAIQHSAQIYFNYPSVQSDLFLGIFARYGLPAAAAIQFFDAKGERISLPGDASDYYRFTINRLEYSPERFPIEPAHLTATIPVVTSPSIVKERYPKDALPDGVTLQGNMLIIDHSAFEPKEDNKPSERPFQQRYQVFAKTSEQRYLAKAIEITHPRSGNAPVRVHYYYGQPEVFEIWYRSETETVDYQVDLELKTGLH